MLRWVWILAKTIAALAVIALLGLGGLLAYSSIDKEDQFFVRDAAPVDPNYLAAIESWMRQESDFHEPTGIYAHRLKHAPGMVFGYRFYSNGSLSKIDDETYKKLTVWLGDGASPLPAETKLGDTTRVLVIYSHGGSAWPEGDCSGFVTTGSLRIAPSGKHVSVSVAGEFKPRGNRHKASYCKTEHVEFSFEASEITVAQLTPWLGREGTHPYDETYRR